MARLVVASTSWVFLFVCTRVCACVRAHTCAWCVSSDFSVACMSGRLVRAFGTYIRTCTHSQGGDRYATEAPEKGEVSAALEPKQTYVRACVRMLVRVSVALTTYAPKQILFC